MTFKAKHIVTLLATAAAFSGCQSAPHWAWWKNDKAADAAAIAKSKEPVLPSAQSTPQAVAVAGLTPASPPSSANLAAAAGAPAATPSGAALTSPSTATNPQIPPFSPANSLADKLTSAPNAGSKSAAGPLPSTSPLTPAAAQASQSVASMPPSGPYDPKGYKPSASSTNGADMLGGSDPSADRYGIGTGSNRIAPSAQPSRATQTASLPENRYGSVPSTAPSTPIAPRAANASLATAPLPAQPAPTAYDRYSSSAMPAAAPAAPSSLSPLSMSTTAASVAAPAPNSMPPSAPASAAQSIQLTSAPGQYRPGGTSTYVGTSTTQGIEVARRPGPPTSANPSAPPTTTPVMSTEPWAPTTVPTTRTF